jgi:holo-[acyl-carrier protein] synthase
MPQVVELNIGHFLVGEAIVVGSRARAAHARADGRAAHGHCGAAERARDMILGLGNDLIDIRRIEEALERFGDRFVLRVFTKLSSAALTARRPARPPTPSASPPRRPARSALGTGCAVASTGCLWASSICHRDGDDRALAAPRSSSRASLRTAMRRASTDAHGRLPAGAGDRHHIGGPGEGRPQVAADPRPLGALARRQRACGKPPPHTFQRAGCTNRGLRLRRRRRVCTPTRTVYSGPASAARRRWRSGRMGGFGRHG